MESLHELEIIVILLAVVLALTTLALRILVPYPILLVVGGLILGVVPGMPRIQLNPNLVFSSSCRPSSGERPISPLGGIFARISVRLPG